MTFYGIAHRSVVQALTGEAEFRAEAVRVWLDAKARNGAVRGAPAYNGISQPVLETLLKTTPGKTIMLIGGARQTLVPSDPAGGGLEDFQNRPGAEEVYAESRRTPTGALEIFLEGKRHVLAYSTVRGTDWVVAVHAPKSALLGDFVRMQRLFLLFFVLAALCFGCLVRNSWKYDRYKALSLLDQLTQTGNRTAYEQAFQKLRRKEDFPAALLICDMDNLKTVNDTLGHESGDLQLQRLGAVLHGCVRGYGNVFRLGGDEFAVLMPGATLENADRLIERITWALEEETLASPDKPALNISIGAALAVNPNDLETLYRRADAAMYAQKIARKAVINDQAKEWWLSAGENGRCVREALI